MWFIFGIVIGLVYLIYYNKTHKQLSEKEKLKKDDDHKENLEEKKEDSRR